MHKYTQMSVIKFKSSPSDTITDILVQDSLIHISSWDCSVYTYDLHTQNLLYKKDLEFPVLKLAWKNGLIFSDTKGFVYFDTNKKLNFNIEGIQVLESFNDHLIIGGFSNKLVKFYDNGSTDIFNMNNKIYSSSIDQNNLILNFGTKIGLYDLRNINLIKFVRTKNFIRSVNIKNNKIYSGDIHGKLKIHDIYTNEEITINAHAETKDNIKRVYPINNILHNDFLYTCGSDGVVNRWNEDKKLKSRCIFKNNFGILKMASIKNRIIVASGYNHEIGPADTSENSIFLIDL